MTGDVAHVTCQELVEVLTDYLDGVLEPSVRADVERHIVICRGCANHVEQMRSTLALLGRLAESEPDGGEDADALLEVFHAWREGR